MKTLYTIGFTKKTAEQFFEILRANKIEQLIDVRLNNTTQLAGFSKRPDIEYFLKSICGATYRHELSLAPTQDMLDRYKKEKGDWRVYEREFGALLRERRVEDKLPSDLFAPRSVLLCSEHTAEHCHRRVVAEYLRDKWGGFEIEHL